MTLQEHINQATIADAKAWNETYEKFTFCIDSLGISAHALYADKWVNALEDKYEELLGAA